MAQVHIIGQIEGATEFSKSDLFCVWKFEVGDTWTEINGVFSGQTQVDQKGSDGQFVFGHPIDVSYSTTTCIGWPKLVIEIWFQDGYGRNDFAGYSVVQIPTATGSYDLEVHCWRPVGKLLEQIKEGLIGGYMQVKDKSLIYNGEDRFKLTTVSVGKLHLKLNILENFNKFGIKMSTVPDASATPLVSK